MFSIFGGAGGGRAGLGDQPEQGLSKGYQLFRLLQELGGAQVQRVSAFFIFQDVDSVLLKPYTNPLPQSLDLAGKPQGKQSYHLVATCNP